MNFPEMGRSNKDIDTVGMVYGSRDTVGVWGGEERRNDLLIFPPLPLLEQVVSASSSSRPNQQVKSTSASVIAYIRTLHSPVPRLSHPPFPTVTLFSVCLLCETIKSGIL